MPLARFPNTYNGQPLGIAALAAQKNHYALYLMGPYMDPAVDQALRDGFRAAGKKLDMGKSCLRFKSVAELAPDAIAAALAAIPPPERLMAMHDAVHGGKRPARAGGRRGDEGDQASLSRMRRAPAREIAPGLAFR